MAMMLVAYPWLVVLAAGWVVGAVFVGAVGGATRGVQGFFVWILAALMFSPLLAMLGLIAVLLGDLVREVEIKAIHGAEELPSPRRSSGRFAHLAGEDD
jgi:xanthosine utilization system XapX-like protein